MSLWWMLINLGNFKSSQGALKIRTYWSVIVRILFLGDTFPWRWVLRVPGVSRWVQHVRNMTFQPNGSTDTTSPVPAGTQEHPLLLWRHRPFPRNDTPNATFLCVDKALLKPGWVWESPGNHSEKPLKPHLSLNNSQDGRWGWNQASSLFRTFQVIPMDTKWQTPIIYFRRREEN